MRSLLLLSRRPARLVASAPDAQDAPRAAQPRQDSPPRARTTGTTPGAHRPPSILIVDDDPLMTDLLPRRLRRVAIPQLRILTANGPDDALRVMSEEQPDVILSDYNLRAALNGLDVLEAAATRAPHAARILFSAHTRREIGARIESAPIHGFIEKTMRLDDLIQPLLGLVAQTSGLDLARRADG